MRTLCILAFALFSLQACQLIEPRYRLLEAQSERALSVQEAAAALADCDVVFLGEEHDSGAAHEVQLALSQALAERRGHVALSLEMFERDVQGWLDLYLRGGITEAEFLARSRPWPNYSAHYRPAVEWARAEGLAVIAANCPRPLASRVAREGIGAVLGDPWCALYVNAGEGAYRDAFEQVMSDHQGGSSTNLQRWFEAQCVKDDTMAESIARYLAENAADQPLVVHWCGRFHSDYGLGTVERLKARLGTVRVGIVTTLSASRRFYSLSEQEKALAHYIVLVPPR